MEDLEKQIKDRVDEIHFEVYNMEDVLDGTYSIGMFGDSAPDLDKAHKEALQALRNYIKILNKYDGR